MLRRDFLTTAAAAAGLAALGGRAVAEPVRTEVSDGFVGRFFAEPGARRRPAVLMLGGSNGGFPADSYAKDLAAAGFPVLTQAYFKGFMGANIPAPLPQGLEEIPLETFFRAIDWMKARPEVNPRRIVLMGESRGGELVLQLASLRRDVAGVVAYVPSHVRWGAVGPNDKAAWTLAGKPLPYLRDSYKPGQPMTQGFLDVLNGDPKAVAAAAIPVERIRGRVLLVSTTSDGIWPSALMAQKAAERIERRARIGRRLRSLTFDNASHLLMGPGPGMTKFTQGAFTLDFGGTEEGTRYARDTAWAAVKQMLGEMA